MEYSQTAPLLVNLLLVREKCKPIGHAFFSWLCVYNVSKKVFIIMNNMLQIQLHRLKLTPGLMVAIHTTMENQ